MAILSNTNQILTVKNLTVGGYYTANEAVATNQLVRSNALTVYDYNPITGYTLNVNINIAPYSTSYVFLPSYFFSNKDFVVAVPTTLSTVILFDAVGYENFNSGLMNSDEDIFKLSIPDGSSTPYYNFIDYNSRQNSSYHWSEPSRMPYPQVGWNCYSLGSSTSEFVRCTLGMPQELDVSRTYNFTNTSSVATFEIGLLMYDPEYTDYLQPDFLYGSSISEAELFRPHDTTFVLQFDSFYSNPRIFNGNGELSYSSSESTSNGILTRTVNITITSLAFVANE